MRLWRKPGFLELIFRLVEACQFVTAPKHCHNTGSKGMQPKIVDFLSTVFAQGLRLVEPQCAHRNHCFTGSTSWQSSKFSGLRKIFANAGQNSAVSRKRGQVCKSFQQRAKAQEVSFLANLTEFWPKTKSSVSSSQPVLLSLSSLEFLPWENKHDSQ